jgi:hypothetical protein
MQGLAVPQVYFYIIKTSKYSSLISISPKNKEDVAFGVQRKCVNYLFFKLISKISVFLVCFAILNSLINGYQKAYDSREFQFS